MELNLYYEPSSITEEYNLDTPKMITIYIVVKLSGPLTPVLKIILKLYRIQKIYQNIFLSNLI